MRGVVHRLASLTIAVRLLVLILVAMAARTLVE